MVIFFCCWWSNTQERMGQILFWHDQNQSVSFSLFQSLCQNIFWLNDSNDFDGHHYSREREMKKTKTIESKFMQIFCFCWIIMRKWMKWMSFEKKNFFLRMIYRIDNRQKKMKLFFFVFEPSQLLFLFFCFLYPKESRKKQNKIKKIKRNSPL